MMNSLKELSARIDKNTEFLRRRTDLEEKAQKAFIDDYPDRGRFDDYMRQIDEIEG